MFIELAGELYNLDHIRHIEPSDTSTDLWFGDEGCYTVDVPYAIVKRLIKAATKK